MNDTVREWVDKAEGDYRTAGRELGAPDFPNYDAVCFHAQQCIEKSMKALLIDKGVSPQRVHDLAFLASALTGVFPEWSWPNEELRALSRSAVEFRYPGNPAS